MTKQMPLQHGTTLNNSSQTADTYWKPDRQQRRNSMMNEMNGCIGLHQETGNSPPPVDPVGERGTMGRIFTGVATRSSTRRCREGRGDETRDVRVGTVSMEGEGGVNGTLRDRAPERQSHTPRRSDHPPTRVTRRCAAAVGPQCEEEDPILIDPTGKQRIVNRMHPVTRWKDPPVRVEGGRSRRGECEWETTLSRTKQQCTQAPPGSCPRKRGGESSDRKGNSVKRNETLEPQLQKVGGSDRNLTGITGGTKKKGGISHTHPSRQNYGQKVGGGETITTHGGSERIPASFKIRERDMRDGTQKGSEQELHSDVRHILKLQHAQLGPVTRSRSRAQMISDCI